VAIKNTKIFYSACPMSDLSKKTGATQISMGHGQVRKDNKMGEVQTGG